MNPVARALDAFQAEKTMYAGMYSVILLKLLGKLKKRLNLKLCSCLRDCLIESIDKR